MRFISMLLVLTTCFCCVEFSCSAFAGFREFFQWRRVGADDADLTGYRKGVSFTGKTYSGLVWMKSSFRLHRFLLFIMGALILFVALSMVSQPRHFPPYFIPFIHHFSFNDQFQCSSCISQNVHKIYIFTA